jgi:DNA-binding winged helix-turn-helix (wHTH) protein
MSLQSYRFGEFELDPDARKLRLRGEPVRLERRPFDLLVLLVTAQGRVVTRDDIIAKLWPPNVIIDFDAGVNTLVLKARSALGDASEEPVFIETVAGYGYRFIAPLEQPKGSPWRRLTNG